MHSECDLYSPPITTSHRRTEDDIVRRSQLLWGGEPTFCISPSSVRKSIWYWFPQTLTHSCSCESHSPTAHTPPMHLPTLNFLNFRSMHATPTHILRSAYTLHMPFSIPPCGHLNCPCWRVGSISIFTPSPPYFQPSSQCYASFICRAGWPIFLVWPPCCHSSPLLHSILLLLHWPQAAGCGCGSRAELEWALQAKKPIQSNPSWLSGTHWISRLKWQNKTTFR